MKRFLLREGDLSTKGGVVLDGVDTSNLLGKPLTYLGARVACPACKATGSIVPRGPRRIHTLSNGQLAALDGDLCQCACTPLPQMLASQNIMHHTFESLELEALGLDGVGNSLPVDEYIEHWYLLEDGEGRPVSGYLLDVYQNNQRIQHKAVFQNGETQRISGKESQVVMWLHTSVSGKQ